MQRVAIVGLGNPGKEYANTWHNAGWLALDALVKRLEAPEFVSNKKMTGLLSNVHWNGLTLLLLKPETFMNNSGRAVLQLLQFYKLTPPQLWLVHDEIDLPLGTIRVTRNASAAGHRGAQSVIEALGSQECNRVRIGIRTDQQGKIPTETFVLQPVDKKNRKAFTQAIDNAAAAVQDGVTHGIEKAMNLHN